MQVGLAVMVAVLAAPLPVSAAGFVIPDDQPTHYAAYSSPEIAHPWTSQQPEAKLAERSMGELMATKIGIADGSAELFRFRVENAPSEKTTFDGVVDGGGIKLKLTW